MEPEIKLIEIFVADQEPEGTEYQTKKDFNKSLRIRPLSEIKNWIYIKYRYKDRDLNLILKQDDSIDNWNVCMDDKLFFSFTFTSKDDKEFINAFEKHLKEKLEKMEQEERFRKNPYSPPPFDPDNDAEISM